ncbi:MAG TPA: hypothetical protein VF159_11105 [Gemmatimonadaceae bacterium]
MRRKLVRQARAGGAAARPDDDALCAACAFVEGGAQVAIQLLSINLVPMWPLSRRSSVAGGCADRCQRPDAGGQHEND